MAYNKVLCQGVDHDTGPSYRFAILRAGRCRHRCSLSRDLFLLAVAVAVHELVDAACGVDEFLLAGEEGV